MHAWTTLICHGILQTYLSKLYGLVDRAVVYEFSTSKSLFFILKFNIYVLLGSHTMKATYYFFNVNLIDLAVKTNLMCCSCYILENCWMLVA